MILVLKTYAIERNSFAGKNDHPLVSQWYNIC